MPMTQISLSGLETETDSVTSKTSTLQDLINPSFMSNTQKDILQIIRKEEDHAMSLLSASPLLSSLFLSYANKAATLDGPQAPSPIDLEWNEMKILNSRLQEEVASLRAQLDKQTGRAQMAEDCVEALRAQITSVKDANRDLETKVSKERAESEAITLQYANHKKEAAETIAELRTTVHKETGARAALSQVIADQQMTLAQLKENECPPSPLPVCSIPVVTKEHPGSWGGLNQRKEGRKKGAPRRQEGDQPSGGWGQWGSAQPGQPGVILRTPSPTDILNPPPS